MSLRSGAAHQPKKNTAITTIISGSTLSTTPHSGSQVHPASQTSATSSSSTTGPLVSAYSDDHSKATPTDAVQDPNQPVDNNNGNGGTNVASNNNNDGNVSTGNDNSNNNGGSNGDSSNYNNSNKDSSDNSNSNVNSNSSDDNNSNDGDGDSSSDADNTTNSEQAPGSLPSPALVGTPASTPNGGDPNGDGNGGINETQAVSGNMSNKTLGIGLGLGIGCVAAVGLAGLLVHNRRKHQDQLASSRSLAGEEDPNVSTRWRPQSFMGVVASVVAKLPRSPSLRSNVSGGRNGNGHVRASTAGMAIGTGEGALESPTHTLGRHPSAASSRSAASQPPSLARVDGHPQDMHEVDLRY
ncbi:hypothetical protein DFQ28_001419 [Apophysomyces sp. BC1034]|nr:hypothetical protein DFQ28_001419 [Apophysomyces sp. BC1034]